VPAGPDRTALLIIECQNGVVGPGSVLPGLGDGAKAKLETIGELARTARASGVLVCHLVFVPIADNRSINTKPTLFRHLVPQLADWTPDHPATQVVDEIGVEDGDLVLPRASGLSPTHGTETFKVLRNIGITQVVVAGISTNIAIPAVLTNAVDEGFDTVVAKDAVIGSPADYADLMVEHTIRMIARVTTVAGLAEEWAGA
jgi:nicotinamidase-related amidase